MDHYVIKKRRCGEAYQLVKWMESSLKKKKKHINGLSALGLTLQKEKKPKLKMIGIGRQLNEMLVKIMKKKKIRNK